MNISAHNLVKLEEALSAIFSEGFNPTAFGDAPCLSKVVEDFKGLASHIEELDGDEDENDHIIGCFADDLASLVFEMGQAAHQKAADREIP